MIFLSPICHESNSCYDGGDALGLYILCQLYDSNFNVHIIVIPTLSFSVHSRWNRDRKLKRHVPSVQGSQEALEDLQIRLCEYITYTA